MLAPDDAVHCTRVRLPLLTYVDVSRALKAIEVDQDANFEGVKRTA